MPEERTEREETVIDESSTGRGGRRRRVHMHEEMGDKTAAAAAERDPDYTDDDLRKPGMSSDSTSNFFTDTIRRSSQAAADTTGGMIEAIGRGVRAYSDSLTNENIMRFGLSNGFVEGMARGYAVFFDEMAATARRVLDTVSEAPDLASGRPRARRTTTVVAAEPIDYDRLARLIAEQIIAESAKKNQAL